jgi:diguanylate cyclase (GGDEF)-like protein
MSHGCWARAVSLRLIFAVGELDWYGGSQALDYSLPGNLCTRETEYPRLRRPFSLVLSRGTNFRLKFKNVKDELGRQTRDIRVVVLLLDRVTHLYNRKGFVRACNHLLTNLNGHSSSAMLLSINLTHLTFIERILGFEIAEDMLKRTADILLEVFQDNALIGRWNADHFVLLSVAAPHRYNSMVRRLNERIDTANSSESSIRLSLTSQFRLIDLPVAARKVRLDRSHTTVH